MAKRKYSIGYADYPGVGRITDEMIAIERGDSTMMWSRKQSEKIHWKALTIEIDAFVNLLTCFKRTAPGVRYYVNCSEEQDTETHKKLAKDILRTLGYIKECDIGAYNTIIHLYKEDIRDVIDVHLQSKAEA